ncbi:cytochrome P450 [Streptomyces xiamenensis]|nr:cytochrome P450 [Streptomyces xiamenensis]
MSDVTLSGTAAEPAPQTLPLTRPNPFDPPPGLTAPAGEPRIRRMTFADGHLGWLATGHTTARAILADPRFSPRPELNHPPMGRAEKPKDVTPSGFFLLMDPPDHTRYRKLLTGQFTVRRMRQLEDRISEIITERLDAMAAAGPPSDLVRDFALPVPSLVICELLGVPYSDRAGFRRDTEQLIDFELPEQQVTAALDRLTGYLQELVARKRAEPADDLISSLAADPTLSDREIAGMATLLLIAGHETTANMLALGTLVLLTDPALRAAAADPATINTTVEELLRYLSVVYVLVRTAVTDVEIEGQLVRAGETVTLHLGAANRDPERFTDADRPGAAAGRPGHLAFGHGIHQCLGQQLARVELRLAFPALLRRFPGLRLAAPPEEVPVRTRAVIHGLHRLPVTW